MFRAPILLVVVFSGALAWPAAAQDVEPKLPRPKSPQVDPISPQEPGLPSSVAETEAQRVAKAHNVRAWRAHDAFTCNISVNFGGHTMLEGSMLVDTNKDRVRFDLTTGITLIWDGEHAWVSPADAQIETPRWHLRTWAYFLKAPFDLDKPGTFIKDQPAATMDGRVFNTFRITFDETSGRDTPEDWVIGYSDLVTHTLYAMAYISTWGGRSVEDAEHEPHIVLFEEPAIVNSVVLPQRWSFYHWSMLEGKYGERVGQVTLRDVGFTQLREDTFAEPEDAREVEAPAAAEDEDDDEDDEEPGGELGSRAP